MDSLYLTRCGVLFEEPFRETTFSLVQFKLATRNFLQMSVQMYNISKA